MKEIIKQASAKALALVFVSMVVGCVSPASAGIILYDDFQGTANSAPDTAKWTAGSQVKLDGSGNVVFTVPPGQTMDALASYDFLPTAGVSSGRLTLQLAGETNSPNTITGLASGGNVILARGDLGGGVWTVYIGNGSSDGGNLEIAR